MSVCLNEAVTFSVAEAGLVQDKAHGPRFRRWAQPTGQKRQGTSEAPLNSLPLTPS